MSEESSSKPADAQASAPEAPPVEPGEFGRKIAAAGLAVTHLGTDANGTEVIGVDPAAALDVARFLRDDPGCQFNLLLSCSGVDWKDHMDSVYALYSVESFKYLILKIRATEGPDGPHSPSLMPVWHAADWHEREAYDLFGIHYDGHEDLRRILMPIDWVGFPLRKDYKNTDPRLVWNER
ncbi:MAG: NADH-quinone oxidoreductase subunit C [Candidatus Melainabacteria bacterium]